jgi:hypothetical protein
MTAPRFSRRSLLATSAKVGAGAAAMTAGLAGGGFFQGSPASREPRSPRRSAARARPRTAATTDLRSPPAPPGVQRFVSRPDLTPPQVRVIRSEAYKDQEPELPRYLFLSPDPVNVKGPIGAMIVDTGGDLVWWSVPPHGVPFNLRPQTYGGQTVLTYWQGDFIAGHGEGYYVMLDTTYRPTRHSPVKAGNGLQGDLHEFLITPYGSALLTSYYEHRGVYQCAAQEVDIATGEVKFQWDTLHNVSLAESYQPKPTKGPYDFFHINSIDLWPAKVAPYHQDLVVSGRNVWAAYRISRDRPGGRTVWKLSGNRTGKGPHGGSFHMGKDTNFEWQHDVAALPDGSGVSIFDDAEGPPSPEKQARGLVLNMDQATRSVTLRHQFLHTSTRGGVQVPYEGNVQLLPNGGYLVGWGGVPFVSEYGPPGHDVDGTMDFDLQLPEHYSSYRAYLYDWKGRPPDSELALVVLPGPSSAQYVAHASWNGATEVASWSLHAGSSHSSSLPEVAAAPRTGFETVIPVDLPGSSLDFQVTALDREGRPLASSRRARPPS